MAENKKELSMELRALLAFALSAVVLFIYAWVQQKYAPPRPPAQQVAQQKEQPKSTEPAATPAGQQASDKPAPGAAPGTAAKPGASTEGKEAAKKEPAAPSAKEATEETETVVENDLYRVVFTNRGAAVKSWTLKKYSDNHGKPLELVNQAAPNALGYSLTIWTDDEELRNRLSNALFQVQASGDRAPATVVFEWSDGTVSARKELSFEHADYVVDITSEVRQGGNPVPHFLTWRGGFGDHTVELGHANTAVVAATATEIERHPHGKISEDKKYGGRFLYAGIEDMYFAAMFMPREEASSDAAIQEVRAFHHANAAQKESPTPMIGVGVMGATQSNNLRAFVGPKALDVLRQVYPQPGAERVAAAGQPARSLAELVDFGWFSLIAKPLFLGLKWIYAHVVPNYGWAIVLITIVINTLLFPLKLKSMRSALKMQKLAPQVKAIQEKYKKLKLTDPKRQQQNQEVMELYKKNGVNPIGGCFPMLLQIPFLYAFYKVLSLSIEMRHAPWFGWVRDLSAKDPYYVLPVLMTLTMFVLQKMTPQTTTDPAQQKMFLMMPFIFGVMFINVSSGLVLYWLVGNLVGIGQQWYINKAGIRPAAARKPVLAGK